MVNTDFKGKSALDLFPDLVNEVPKKSKSGVPIPQPPDTSWLTEGLIETDKDVASDSLTALVVIIEDNKRILVENTLKEMRYTTSLAFSAAHAIEKIKWFRFNLIICGQGAAFKEIHKYICGLSSAKRRVIYYAIVGPRLHTLYDLEALALSANVVINNKDLQYLKRILSKGFNDYEKLFRPLLDELSVNSSLI